MGGGVVILAMSACGHFYFLNLLSSTVYYSNPIFSVHYICSAESRVKLWKKTGKCRQELGVDRKGKLSKLTSKKASYILVT